MKQNEYQRDWRRVDAAAKANKPADWNERDYYWDKNAHRWVKWDRGTPEQQAERQARLIAEINESVVRTKKRLDHAREELAKFLREGGVVDPEDGTSPAAVVRWHEKEYEHILDRQKKGR